MNRIILIGNGFDLAHGLNTSYSDFIDYFWKKKIEEIKVCDSKNSGYNDKKYLIVRNSACTLANVSGFQQLNNLYCNSQVDLIFHNEFLRTISERRYEKWVDIEELYFKCLMENINSPDDIEKLNKDFNDIQCEFEEYLNSHVSNSKSDIYKSIKYNNQILHSLFNKNLFREFNRKAKNELINLFILDLNNTIENLNNDINYNKKLLIRYEPLIDVTNNVYSIDENKVRKYIDDLKIEDVEFFLNRLPDNFLFLNFNYTSTFNLYLKESESGLGYGANCVTIKTPDFINIHGQLKDEKNPIVFGYGDEISADYKTIENLNDNNLLEFVKSIKYLETDNYKKLLEYIDSDLYQIYVMGHSCGNSDRTLLNTIFEHDNCASIKVFYHQISDEKDNYSDVIRNISRNFTDKKKMRDRVVNKMYCEPLVSLNR